ncbi:iron-containing alcohol dehydrogenase [Aliifodinibius sp. S!AR15-10]|uniref:iron-containing alcohol dehydrogenase n=1 Tax=Aliifodinibius sp. S!AR15-10 TaxID=2950437 RepID=UPI00285DB00E|nr:iron-containing alcohol dehydrogenase [Aliifodinibius sp. S!AR15-10]MDR8391071.1 iron-containing alcohol dehydrogenase [Aliifodinibius sp. S!AR15-10]
MTHSFNIPSTIISGAGARKTLADQLNRLKIKRVLFVTDSFFSENGLVDEMSLSLNKRGIFSAVFSDVQPDPTVEIVQQGLQHLKEFEAEALIAVGGGSSIDTAKAISILKTNPEPLNQYMGYHKVKNPGIPMIAIPTTAGTGSEVTKVTVITDTKSDTKMMMLDAFLLPTIAIVDYELTISMPKSLTAYVGVDTLTHAVEAYVSKKANVMTDPIALSCIRLVSNYLTKAWKNPNNHKAREGMALAACHGGMAFSNSSVCLIHGMSRPLGVQFHLPHGLSNAVLLPTVTRFSISGAKERYANVAKILGFASSKDSIKASNEALIDGLLSLNDQLKIPSLQNCVDVDKKKFEEVLGKMAQDALDSGSPQNNPVVPTVDQIMELYKQAW